jgi:uncharacterized protein (TIGR02466 family)
MNIQLFGVPVLHKPTNFEISSTELTFVKNLNYNQGEEKEVNISKNSFLLNSPELERIKNFIIKEAVDYKNNVLEIDNDIYLTQSWSTINTKGKSHHPHGHRNTFFSIVYYIECEDGNFVLDNYRSSLEKGFFFSYKIKKYNTFNSPRWEFKVKTKDIIIFPGWIRHYSTVNNSNKERIAIGANFFLKGELGEYDQYSLIKI